MKKSDKEEMKKLVKDLYDSGYSFWRSDYQSYDGDKEEDYDEWDNFQQRENLNRLLELIGGVK